MFCIISFYFPQPKLGFRICFFNCKNCKCSQLSHNSIKRDLDNRNVSPTTLGKPLFSWTTSGVHIFNLRLQDYNCKPQEPTSSHIHTYSFSYFQKVVIGRFLNVLLIPRDKCYELVRFLFRTKWSNLGWYFITEWI